MARFVRRNNISAEVPTSSNLKVTDNCLHTNATNSKSKLQEMTSATAKIPSPNVDSVSPAAQTSEGHAASTAAVSPRRRRKNFTPRKVIDCDVHIGSVPQVSNDFKVQPNILISLPAAVNNDGNDNNNVDDDDDDDENIDVCF